MELEVTDALTILIFIMYFSTHHLDFVLSVLYFAFPIWLLNYNNKSISLVTILLLNTE